MEHGMQVAGPNSRCTSFNSMIMFGQNICGSSRLRRRNYSALPVNIQLPERLKNRHLMRGEQLEPYAERWIRASGHHLVLGPHFSMSNE
jgi:hypothetical protein